MIGIATYLYDENGDVVFYELPSTILEDSTPRVSRIATLDGGCVINHLGFADADRTFDIDAELDKSTVEIVRWIFENHQSVYLATSIGLFFGSLSRFKNESGRIKLTFWVKEKTA